MDYLGMPKQPVTIKQKFPISNGLFAHMDYTFRAEVSKPNLDIMFLANFGKRNPSPMVDIMQGEGDTDRERPLNDGELTLLAQLIVSTYKEKWDKLGDIYDIEYDPIHNYLDEWEDTSAEDRELTGSTQRDDETKYGKVDTLSNTRTDNLSSARTVDDDRTVTRTDNLTELETRNLAGSDARTDNLTEQHSYGKSETRTDNLTEVVDQDETNSKTGSAADNIYGFNSSTAVGADTSSNSDSGSSTNDVTTHNTGTQTLANTGSDSISNSGTQSHTTSDTGTVTTANTGTQGVVTDATLRDTTLNTGTRQLSQTDTLSGKDEYSRDISTHDVESTDKDRSGRHFGNIGNLTSQKQILEEINLWKWNYVNSILDDVKEFCTLPVYLNGFGHY